MADLSKIEWCDSTWNPVVGCSPVDPGCANCYAVGAAARVERQAAGRVAKKLTDGDARLMEAYRGLTVIQPNGVRGWAGVVRCLPERLEQPFFWRKPRTIFVNSMSDLFHEDVPFDFIDRVFATMALCPEHKFIVLTKRSKRMRDWCQSYATNTLPARRPKRYVAERRIGPDGLRPNDLGAKYLPNVVLGVSVSDQVTADKHIPNLLATPARWRAVSYEPGLGAVDFTRINVNGETASIEYNGRPGIEKSILRSAFSADCWYGHVVPATPGGPAEIKKRLRCHFGDTPPISWVIVGGESGPRARPFDLAWALAALKQCRAAGVAFFFKQAGRSPFTRYPQSTSDGEWLERYLDTGVAHYFVGPCGDVECHFRLRDSHGGDLDEVPDDLRVREFPWDVEAHYGEGENG